MLAFSAKETADVLDVTVDSVTSALARACATMRARQGEPLAYPGDAVEQETVDRYVEAFEAYDVDRLVRLLADDVTFSMPPMAFWLRGAAEVGRWWRGPGDVCRDSRMLRGRLNGRPALACYHPAERDVWEPFAVHVLEVSDAGISAITHFHDAAVFADLGMPTEIVADRPTSCDLISSKAVGGRNGRPRTTEELPWQHPSRRTCSTR